MSEEKVYSVERGMLKVSTTITKVEETKFDYDYLVKQKEAIEAQKAEQIAARDKEIAEIDELILEAKKAGLDIKE